MSRVEGKIGGFNSTSPGFGSPLPEQIAEVLAEEIVERKVASGSKLPEPELAERFGASRPRSGKPSTSWTRRDW